MISKERSESRLKVAIVNNSKIADKVVIKVIVFISIFNKFRNVILSFREPPPPKAKYRMNLEFAKR